MPLDKQLPGPALSAANPDEVGEINLGKYLRVIRKRIWVIAAVVALGVTAVVFYTMRRTKIYQATASVQIDPSAAQVFGSKFQDVVPLGPQSTWQNQEYYNTQVEILAGYELAQQTVIANRLYENPELVPPVPNDTRTRDELIKEATLAFRATLSASQNRDSRIVNVHVKHSNSDLAIELANKHIETFLEYTRNLRTEGGGKVAEFLAQELDAAQTRLKNTETELLKFKKENDILSMSLEDKESILAKDIGRYSDALSETQVKRLELSNILGRLKKLSGEAVLDSPLFGLTSTLTSNATLIGMMKDSYFREKQRLTELGEELGPKHPSYASQKAKVDDILTSIDKEAKLAVRELDERYAALLANERSFSEQLDKLKTDTFELAPKSLEYARMVRQQQSDEANYNLVLERLRDSELSSHNTEINVRTNAIARDTELVYPRMSLNIALGLLGSLILALGLAFFLEFLDRTLKSSEDVDAAVGAPLLGVIPVVEQGTAKVSLEESMKERDLYVFRHPTSRVAECCRAIRTNILFSAADKPMKTLTISSPRPREGKTTSTIYMGAIMAQSGQRVLLVDTDLRRPRLHKSLGISRARGLTNLIMGDAEIDEVVKTTDIPNLYLLPCGPSPPNPAELLLTQRFKDVLHQLQARYDRILLDSPPILAVTDAVILSRLSDGVVLIAQAGKTASEDARLSAKALRDVDAPILGVILNDMDISDRRYGYYYYQYAYGDKPAEPAPEAPSG